LIGKSKAVFLLMEHVSDQGKLQRSAVLAPHSVAAEQRLQGRAICDGKVVVINHVCMSSGEPGQGQVQMSTTQVKGGRNGEKDGD
jgi:hypothetical protein